MGFIKDIANQPKLQTFPSSQYVVAGDVPASQCSDAKLQGDSATTQSAPDFRLFDPGKFVGWMLGGRVCEITASVGGNTGTFDIVGNLDDSLALFTDPGVGDPVEYYIRTHVDLINTRNIQTFAEFIHAAGYAYTIKGGQLYTNIPTAELQNACKILFAPLT